MSKDEEIRNIQARRRNLLFLMQRYLNDNGLYATAAQLAKEARLCEDYELCDNIDLDAIYLEYASYYQLKFGKYPKILKRISQPVKLELAAKRKKGKAAPPATATATKVEAPDSTAASTFDVNDLQVTVKKMETLASRQESATTGDGDTLEKKRQLESLQQLQHGPSHNDDLLLTSVEWQALADVVKSTILNEDLQLKWSDVCGNFNALEIIKEAVVTPIKYPQLFSQGLKPWRSVLLHGPPGSGKTLMAKVLYSETKSMVTFFNITASMVVSKWRGESEKLLRILFHMAQRHSPAIIFLDEIEGLTSKRDRATDHESSKRFKNELLQLMDGMEHHSAAGVFVLASTNMPWEIDPAFLRRFEKKLLVQLPNEVERSTLIGKMLPLNFKVSEQQMATLVKLSSNFTGDEIRLACKEIAMQSVRRLTKATLKGNEGAEVAAAATAGLSDLALESAFRQIKPLSLSLMERHGKWQREHGT